MVQTAMFELQKGIFQNLTSNPSLTAKVTGVFDSVNEGQEFPYITISEPFMLPFETKQKFGEELSIVIHGWSTYNGKKEAIDILNLCLASLAMKMNLDGFAIQKVEVSSMRVFDDADPRIKHGVLTMKYTIQNN
ncbi:DUF3168 domain-containing protein [Sporosarcina sp. SAFN-010]|uniref:DUF3168 domain-containing protein n=1 Tax=Sporosarcina sp. SAFN-010 TaxID=3387273 RepID=UPI003F7FF497